MKINPKIYKINKSHRLLKTYKISEEICKGIIKVSRLKFDSKFELKETDYKINQDNDLWFFLYLYKTHDVDSEWINFFPTNFTKDADFNQQKYLYFFLLNIRHNYVA